MVNWSDPVVIVYQRIIHEIAIAFRKGDKHRADMLIPALEILETVYPQELAFFINELRETANPK